MSKPKSMKLKLLGVRGSRPTHKIGLLGHGGNSTSMQFILEGADYNIYLDGGSGLAHHGMRIGESPSSKDFHFLITHTHWDHILGFPFLAPLFNEQNTVNFYSSRSSTTTFKNLFFDLHREANLPVPVSKMNATINFNDVEAGTNFKVKDVDVSCYQINHQAITLAYRLNYKGNSVAIVTDNAPIHNGNYMGEGMAEKAKGREKEFEKEFDDGLIKFLKDCHTVVFDTHFTMDNLKADWGHSTPQHALDFCSKAGVKRLVLFHHAPEDLDTDVDAKVESIRDEAQRLGVEVVAAVEGKVWELS